MHDRPQQIQKPGDMQATAENVCEIAIVWISRWAYLINNEMSVWG